MQQNKPVLALALRLASAGLLATMLALTKFASQRGVTVVEVVFWRQVVGVVILLIYLVPTGQMEKLRTRRASIHFRRAVLGMVTLTLNLSAAILLPLPVATTLGFTTPLFVVLLSVLFLKERIGPWRTGAVALGFIGVLVITRPGLGGGQDIPLLGAMVGLSAAFMIAAINFQIRDLARTETTIAMTFYFAAFGAPLAALFLPFYGTISHDATDWLILLAVGVVGTACQLFLGASLRFASVSTVITMDYSAIVWASFYGWLIWDHPPTPAMLLGAPLIIAAGLIIAWREHRLSKQASPSSPAALD